jgi:hypothetical protein
MTYETWRLAKSVALLEDHKKFDTIFHLNQIKVI